MSAETYFAEAQKVYDRIRSTQVGNIQRAAQCGADSIAQGGLVHLFGSGHSVIPVLDVFPRYGSFAGFHPLMDSPADVDAGARLRRRPRAVEA